MIFFNIYTNLPWYTFTLKQLQLLLRCNISAFYYLFIHTGMQNRIICNVNICMLKKKICILIKKLQKKDEKKNRSDNYNLNDTKETFQLTTTIFFSYTRAAIITKPNNIAPLSFLFFCCFNVASMCAYGRQDKRAFIHESVVHRQVLTSCMYEIYMYTWTLFCSILCLVLHEKHFLVIEWSSTVSQLVLFNTFLHVAKKWFY